MRKNFKINFVQKKVLSFVQKKLRKKFKTKFGSEILRKEFEN